jgi:hypothetical protein
MKLSTEQKDKLTKMASMIKKAAAPDNTGFDEKPAAQKTGPEAKVQPEPPQPAVEEQPAAEAPQDEPQGPTMQDVMSVSARGFLGPEIFDAALNGDPNAQNMIALTAANVAVKMGEIYMRQGAMRAQEQEQMPEQVPDDQGNTNVDSNSQREAATIGAKQESPRQQMAV